MKYTLAQPPRRARCLKTLRSVWMAMLVAVGAYALIGSMVVGKLRLETPLPWAEENLFSAFYGLAILLFAAIVLLRHKFLPDRNGPLPLPTAGEENDESAACSRYLSLSLISYALAEAIGLLGLVLYLLTGVVNPFYLLLGTSLTALWLYRPRQDELECMINGKRTDR